MYVLRVIAETLFVVTDLGRDALCHVSLFLFAALRPNHTVRQYVTV